MTQRERVLGWCNRIREQEHMEPLTGIPPGVRQSAEECSIARATGATMFISSPNRGHNPEPYLARGEWVGAGKFRYRKQAAPEYVASFTRNFDRGGYPDLHSSPQSTHQPSHERA